MAQAIQTSAVEPQSGDGVLAELGSTLMKLSATETIEYAAKNLFADKTALVSSFGAASVVLLHMVSKTVPDLPILFVDTGKLFKETLDYRDQLQNHFSLSNIQTITPGQNAITTKDPNGMLWQDQPDICCEMRKVSPLAKALEPYSAWISGRKRYQSGHRQALSIIELDGAKYKINPLAFWTASDVDDYMKLHRLPKHPLIAKGYPSIGCAPCTSPIREGEDERAGRWRGADKTECGIHFTTNHQTDTRSAPADKLRRIKSWA